MTFFETIAVAFSMYSALPMPQFPWTGRNMRYAMAAFPLVGVLCGAAVWLWAWLSALLDFGPLLTGAGLALAPVLVTGGIHLDGFCDTTDALASHAGRGAKAGDPQGFTLRRIRCDRYGLLPSLSDCALR